MRKLKLILLSVLVSIGATGQKISPDLESAYYTAEWLNIWMNSEDDVILNRVYDEWEGTANHNPVVKGFFKELKARFPETIFHGTDVGHQYKTTGKWYLDYLAQHNKEDSYSIFSKATKTGDVLPYGNYPMEIKTGQVFVIDYFE